jgi:hypothetical protein
MESPDLEKCVIRILNTKGNTVGTGFLLAPRLAVTCTHVVKSADGQPGSVLQVGIVQPNTNSYPVHVLSAGWSETHDVAFLEFTETPGGLVPVRLGRAYGCEGHAYASLGFPNLGPILATRPQAAINGLVPVENQGELLQLKGEEIKEGMSGAPVLDLTSGEVVGMINGYCDDRTRLAYATPGETIAKLSPMKVILHSPLPAFAENTPAVEGRSRDHSPRRVFLCPPLPPQGVIGRQADLDLICEWLALDAQPDQDIPLTALRGMGGIGKTTLALALAHQANILQHLRDGVLWTSLGPKPTIRLLLQDWGKVLGVDLNAERDETACRDRLRDALHDRQMLIIVDDVWETRHGGLFNIAGSGCRLVYTTRNTTIANDLVTRARVLQVDVLAPEAAFELLRTLAPEAALADEKSARRLCERLEFLPLAITLAGRLLANEADIPSRMRYLLGELIERREARLQLTQAEGRPGLDEENPVSLQAILGMSVERLALPDQDRFAMLAIFGGEPLTWQLGAVKAVWDCSQEEAEATVSRLLQQGLIERRGERYWMHALLADYANKLMEERGL